MVTKQKHTRLFFPFVALSLTLSLTIVGCGGSPTPKPQPTFALEVSPGAEVQVGKSVAIVAKVEPLEKLDLKWSVSGTAEGKLNTDTGEQVVYTAGKEGTDIVVAEGTTDSGAPVKQTVALTVVGEPTAEAQVPPPPTAAPAPPTATPQQIPTATPTATLSPTAMPTPMPTPTSTTAPTSTPTATPTLPPSPTIMITTPLTEVECPLNDECRFTVRGTSSGVASDPDLKVIVFVRPGWSNEWWPRVAPSISSDGTWQGNTQIGDEPCWPAGDNFEIVAVVMTRDQANRITEDFQPLPHEYVAQSDFVNLVTTYAPVQIDLSLARQSSEAGSSITLSAEQTSLEIGYDLGTGSWVLVTVPVHQDMSCMKELEFSISFSLQGTGEANSLEVKLEDTDGTNYGWRRHQGSATANLEQTLQLPLDLFEFWWDLDGQDEDMNWQQVMNIQFAVSEQLGDAGGAGSVTIRDVVMVSPITP